MKRSLLALSGGLLLLAGGCRREPTVVFDRLEVLAPELLASGDLGLDAAALQERAVQALSARGLKRVEPGHDGAVHLKAALELVADEGQAPELQGVVAVRLGAEGTVLEVQSSATAVAATGGLEERRASLEAALQLLLQSLSSKLAAGLRARNRTADQLVEELGGDDAHRKQAALEALAERKDPRVLPALVTALHTDDPARLRQVLGRLIQLGDARAVPDIIEAARGKDAVFQREVVFALGALGGDEAEAYLDVMAEGHDQPLMRESAQRALDELRQRAHPKPKKEGPR